MKTDYPCLVSSIYSIVRLFVCLINLTDLNSRESNVRRQLSNASEGLHLLCLHDFVSTCFVIDGLLVFVVGFVPSMCVLCLFGRIGSFIYRSTDRLLDWC